MYVNFEQLAASGLSYLDLINLLAIRQKEDLVIQSINEQDLSRFIESGFVERLKSGSVKLTKKGASFLNIVETPMINQTIHETFIQLKELYEYKGKEIGTKKEAEHRLCWFMNNTNFKQNVILSGARKYLLMSGEYTMSLCNLIWRPPSTAFSVHMNLKNSKLFDIISTELKIGTELYYAEKRSREMEWLFSVAKLPNPPAKGNPDYLFTGSSESDKQRLFNIKTYLLNYLRSGCKR